MSTEQLPWSARVYGWAKDRNLIEGSTAKHQLKKLLEEVGELAAAVALEDEEEIADGIGDACVVLRIICEQSGLDWDACLETAWDAIKDRKGRMVNGVFVKEV